MSTAATSQKYADLADGQKKSLIFLRTNFGLSEGELARCLFFRKDEDEPWIPPDILEAIARKTGTFQHIGVVHDKYVREREQVIYTGTVIDQQERNYTRTGVALIGEAPSGFDIDTDVLAQGRALGAALTAAGFNPFKASSVVETKEPSHSGPLNEEQKQLHQLEDESTLRLKDLRQIHAIAERKGLIHGRDMSRYRNWLLQYYGTTTAAIMDAASRAAVINQLNDAPETGAVVNIANASFELQADAAIA